MANTVLALDQFQPKHYGSAQVTVKSRNRIIPSEIDHQVSSSVPDNKALLVDPSAALIELVFMPLKVENDRIVRRQISGTAASIIAGFTTIERTSRIVIDKSVAFSGNGFPSWMAPLV